MTAEPKAEIEVDKGYTRASRPTSFVAADFGVPHGREEEWRFTPMRRIRPLFDVDGYEGAATVEVEAPEGVRVSRASREEDATPVVGVPGDYPAAIAWEKFQETTTVTIPKEMEAEEPIFVSVTSPEEMSTSRIVVNAEPLSKATVVIQHSGSAKLNETVEVVAGDGADLKVVAVHDWAADALHAASHRVQTGRDTTLRHYIVTLGGDLVRVNIESHFAGPGAHLYLDGLYFVDEGQHIENRVFMDHTEAKCFTRSTYKGALQGKGAQAVWIGDCLIGGDADGTDTYEMNRNLILTEGAHVDSVPNLEIEDGDIEGAGHASAIGRFDDEQLFYLMSRGIPELEARRLVVRGFFAEVLNTIGIRDLQQDILDKVEGLLEHYVAQMASQN